MTNKEAIKELEMVKVMGLSMVDESQNEFQKIKLRNIINALDMGIMALKKINMYEDDGK